MFSKSEHSSTFLIQFDTLSGLFLLQFSLKTAGLYKATISDDRGKDMSQIDISGKGKHIFHTQFISLIN